LSKLRALVTWKLIALSALLQLIASAAATATAAMTWRVWSEFIIILAVAYGIAGTKSAASNQQQQPASN